MKKNDWTSLKLNYEITEIRRTGISRLKDLDNMWERIAYFFIDLYAAFKYVRGKR